MKINLVLSGVVIGVVFTIIAIGIFNHLKEEFESRVRVEVERKLDQRSCEKCQQYNINTAYCSKFQRNFIKSFGCACWSIKDNERL